MEIKNNLNLQNSEVSKNSSSNNTLKINTKISNNDPTNSIPTKNFHLQSPSNKILLKSRRHSLDVRMLDFISNNLRKSEKEDFSISPVREISKKKNRNTKKKSCK